jgi:hypothetical protein
MAELDAKRAQVLSIAAKTIQRRVRTHQARRHYLALRKKTIYVQSLWRGRCNIVWTSLNRTVSLSTVGHLAT